MVEVIAVNYLGKLMELGQKCKFVVDPVVVDAPSNGVPSFKCTLTIRNHDISVEHTAANKKGAKAVAAQMAFEKICERIDTSKSASIDIIAAKLKELNTAQDQKIPSIEYGKKLASLDVSKVNPENGNSYSELEDLFSTIQCALHFDYGETTSAQGSVETYFVCEIRPVGVCTSIVSAYGWSNQGLDEARSQAINQLLSLLKIYSSDKSSLNDSK